MKVVVVQASQHAMNPEVWQWLLAWGCMVPVFLGALLLMARMLEERWNKLTAVILSLFWPAVLVVAMPVYFMSLGVRSSWMRAADSSRKNIIQGRGPCSLTLEKGRGQYSIGLDR